MYNFSYFKEQDQQVVLDFIESHPFAFLTGSTLDGKQVATQIPLLYELRDGQLFLQGHIMRKTDHHKAFMENPQVLAVFTGPHCYVSATWYSHPHIGSTWNYMSVHCQGSIRFMTSNELIQFMKKFSLKFEGGNAESATIYDNLPTSYVESMLPAIVGFEIPVESMENVFKLSQNRDEASYMNIIARLEELGGDSAMIAEEMKKRKDALFKK
ncbi:MAG: FMN-binding negative transcriptional regulator [Candidatus Kapabacteria bacterium]|nr:FMN-binding negative transcriptional regulator [Candidatus Kapabacteria bacterium]